MSNPSTMPSYALINTEELTRLLQAGANRSAITTYLCLIAHDYKRDGFVFPSVRRIHRWLGEAISISSIEKALKWLVDEKIIIRGHRRSTKRFQLITRKAITLAKGLFDTATKSAPKKNPSNPTGRNRKPLRHKRNSVGNSSFNQKKGKSSIKSHRGNFERFDNHPDRRFDSKEERFVEAVLAHLVAPSVWSAPEPPECLHGALTLLEKMSIEEPINFINSKTKYETVRAFIINLVQTN